MGVEVHFIDIEKSEEDDKAVEERLQFSKEVEKNSGILSKLTNMHLIVLRFEKLLISRIDILRSLEKISWI